MMEKEQEDFEKQKIDFQLEIEKVGKENEEFLAKLYGEYNRIEEEQKVLKAANNDKENELKEYLNKNDGDKNNEKKEDEKEKKDMKKKRKKRKKK